MYFEIDESESFPFGVNYPIKQLSVEMRASMEPVTNGQTIEWYKVNLKFGKISEAKIKTEAVKFFDLSDEEQSKDKKIFKKRIEDFVKNQKNIEQNLVREILKAKHGLGKNCENPPQDFLTDVECEKERRLKFLKTARDEMKCGSKYKDWCSQEFKLFDSHYETVVRKLEQE